MKMTIQALRAFQAAAQMGSFTRAAESLYMTQPAFSRLIASLEEEIGLPLFDRQVRHVSLNPQGRQFLLRVNQILETYDLLLNEMQEAKERRLFRLSIGYNPVSGPPEFLLNALQRIEETCPEMHVHIRRAYSDELLSMLESGQLDCALVSGYYFDHSQFETLLLQPINLYALFSLSHPLAASDSVSVSDLRHESLYFVQSMPKTIQSLQSAFQSSGLPFPGHHTVLDLDELIMRVRISTITGISSFRDPNGLYPDLVARPIRECCQPSPNNGRVLAWPRDSRCIGVQKLIEVLRASRQHSDGPFWYDD